MCTYSLVPAQQRRNTSILWVIWPAKGGCLPLGGEDDWLVIAIAILVLFRVSMSLGRYLQGNAKGLCHPG